MLGLLEVVRGGVGNRARGIPNKYRLTYLPQDATDEWRKIETMEEARHRIAAVKNSRSCHLGSAPARPLRSCRSYRDNRAGPDGRQSQENTNVGRSQR